MDWKDNDEQAAFRTEVQDVIQTKLPSRYEDGGDWEVDRVHEDPAARQAAQATERSELGQEVAINTEVAGVGKAIDQMFGSCYPEARST